MLFKYIIQDMETFFFKEISQFYSNSEKFHIFYRKSLYEYIASIIDNKKIQLPYIYGNNNKWISYMDNFNNIIYTDGYVGEYEIIKTSNFLHSNMLFINQIKKIQQIKLDYIIMKLLNLIGIYLMTHNLSEYPIEIKVTMLN